MDVKPATLRRSRSRMTTLRRCATVLGALVPIGLSSRAIAQVPGGSLDPATIPQFVAPLHIPGVMPPAPPRESDAGEAPEQRIRRYDIELVQFAQQMLPTADDRGVPTGFAPTTVWSYGAVGRPETRYSPAETIEARRDQRVQIHWVNNLKDPGDGHFIPHLFPIDATLHWANPGQLPCSDGAHTDCKPLAAPQTPYRGPVPMVTHLHGAHVEPHSDGYPAAWFLPAATDIPADYATRGSSFGQLPGAPLEPGAALFQYDNDQEAATLWIHDHTLGMTRANIYAGAMGFYLIRDSRHDALKLPGPPPVAVDGLRTEASVKALRELPIAIADRSFNADGSLFYPAHRDFFEGLPDGTLESLGVQFAGDGQSDVAPIWQPEFFGNTIVVNGQTWPQFSVERQRYRFRLLNASDARFLILRFEGEAVEFQQIGGDQGFLPAPLRQKRLLIAPSDRADVVVDFSGVPAGTRLVLENVGPDEPFGGGQPCTEPGTEPGSGCDFMPADPRTTGRVMAFDVRESSGPDPSRVPSRLPVSPLTLTPSVTRRLSLNEEMSHSQRVCIDPSAALLLTPGTANDEAACAAAGGTLEPFGPSMALLGTVDADGNPVHQHWDAPVTENPALDSTETWELYNFTADAHPIHLHLVSFQVMDRQALAVDAEGIATQPAELLPGTVRPPEPSEAGFEDTVIAYPGEVTRIAARFDKAGLYVWHCHILEHEDNEMMRPFCVGDPQHCPLPLAPLQ